MEKTFPPTEGGIASSQAFVDASVKPPKAKAMVILDEIVSNIVRCSGASSFSLNVTTDDNGAVKMVFTDDGRPFDPTAVAEPDLELPVEERSEGGLGMFMVRKLSKSVSYSRNNDRNELTVVI